MAMREQKLEFPIEIDGATGATFAGYFYPAQVKRREVLQVLVHGVSYDHRYWDAGTVNGQDYSYARYMVAQGFDVLAIDLPGAGPSPVPKGSSILVETVGKAISNLINSLREPDAIPGCRFGHISLVGHSMGCVVAVKTQATWSPADSLVVTGIGYLPSRARAVVWGRDRRNRDALLDSEYALVPLEVRLKFYYPPQMDPDVIAYDNEVLVTPALSSLWADCIRLWDDPESGAAEVTCPVYVQLGQHDPIMPGKHAEQERKCYTSSPAVTADELRDIGHCFNLHLNREQGWRAISGYLDRVKD
jgi:pimeloyl-ACP methyl ester carboxylesterase